MQSKCNIQSSLLLNFKEDCLKKNNKQFWDRYCINKNMKN